MQGTLLLELVAGPHDHKQGGSSSDHTCPRCCCNVLLLPLPSGRLLLATLHASRHELLADCCVIINCCPLRCAAQGLVSRGAYTSWVQRHVVQAQYVKVRRGGA